jgi:hypothetical protein
LPPENGQEGHSPGLCLSPIFISFRTPFLLPLSIETAADSRSLSLPTFHPVQIGDIPRLAEFCAHFPGDGRPVDFWVRRMKHWWIENPAMTEDWPMGYQLHVNGSLEGINLTIPLRILVEGHRQLASLGTTWRVMPAHRAWSMALSHNVDMVQNHLLRFNGTPSPQVLKILPLSFKRHRERLPCSQIPAHPLALGLKALGRPCATRPLPKLILPEPAPILETIAASVDAAWNATGPGTTGPVRDWRYWEWFSVLNPTIGCFTAILPGDPTTSAPALCALLAEFGDGKLQVVDLWPSTAPTERITALLGLILRHARRARFHSLLVPHWNERIAAACVAQHRYRTQQESAAVWISAFALPAETTECYWPLHTGDALL